MSFSLSVTDRAAREIAAARAEYAQHGKAADFMASVDHVFERLFEHPRMYPVVYDTVHRALLRRFPFAVFFVVEDSDVVVLAVSPQRSDPAGRPGQ
jgi:plasmid stabilization system protein ParE